MAHAQYFVADTEDYSELHGLFVLFQGIAAVDLAPFRDLLNR